MSNSPQNAEQSTLTEQTENQRNPGAAHPSDFKINEDRGPGQDGDTASERAKLLAEANSDNASEFGRAIPLRHEVPHRRLNFRDSL
jgi:hypothetical protein